MAIEGKGDDDHFPGPFAAAFALAGIARLAIFAIGVFVGSRGNKLEDLETVGHRAPM
jgi:hypothetical protein